MPLFNLFGSHKATDASTSINVDGDTGNNTIRHDIPHDQHHHHVWKESYPEWNKAHTLRFGDPQFEASRRANENTSISDMNHDHNQCDGSTQSNGSLYPDWNKARTIRYGEAH